MSKKILPPTAQINTFVGSQRYCSYKATKTLKQSRFAMDFFGVNLLGIFSIDETAICL